MNKTPVSLLTGFLGSGKTTLLSGVLNQPEMADAVVIVNEFGEVGIDHLVVANVTEHVIELRNGCLCCTIRGDLALTLRGLYEQRLLEEIPRFERVVVETSGLADPLPLAHTLTVNPPIKTAYYLSEIVTVVDASNAVATLKAHQTAADQIALADIVVISKTDLVSETEIVRVRRLLEEINSNAEFMRVVKGAVDSSLVFGRNLFEPDLEQGRLGAWLAVREPHRHTHETAYSSHLISVPGALSLAGTAVFLNHAVNAQRDQILRVKGLAGFKEKGGRPGLIHAVRDKFYPVHWLEEWPDHDHSSRLVFIGRDLETRRLDEEFESLCV